MIFEEDDYLAHYGTPRKSGRYPWGSGGNLTDTQKSQRNKSFLDYVYEMLGMGLTETQIAEGLGINTTELRARRSIASNQQKAEKIAMAVKLKDKSYSNAAIAEKMGLPNESSVRSLLKAANEERVDILQTTATMLKDQVAKKEFVDIGSGVENQIGISATKLGIAAAILKEEGYEVHNVLVDQPFGQGKTKTKVLAPPGTTYKDIVTQKDKIQQVTDFSEDHGRSYMAIQPPIPIKSSRVDVVYAEQGGDKADGVIYVRPGVEDVSLGGSRYAQVRIDVDGTHFLKGMAMYKDDLPEGVDLQFNTNKSNTGKKLDAMKPLKDDEDNPFGAIIRQRIDPITGKNTSVMNIVGSKDGSGEEGGWESWSKNLSSQFLSKQSPALAKQQLNMTYESKKRDLDEILALNNPAVKKLLLDAYADEADSSAVHLQAAPLPRQATHVILPVNSLKPTEVYAPNYRNGERVALVRYPHGGTFEIPELVVNNNHPESKALLGRAKDAIGINAQVANRLSGADFDGDTVVVIPNNSGAVKSTAALAGLKDFDPQRAYPAYEGMPKMSARTKQAQMGQVSNLITDMTIRGANTQELARAIRHSMVVIDAEKHNLDYKRSARENGIAALKREYQGASNAGASTLISKASSPTRVNMRRTARVNEGGPIDPKTGKKVFVETGESWPGKNGKPVFKKMEIAKLADTDDANTLSSGTIIEKVYADHSNRLKALANEARKEMVATPSVKINPSSKAAYKAEVDSLNAKLNIALKNRPLERQALIIANAAIDAKRQANPNMDPADLKKVKSIELTRARVRTQAKKQLIDITPDEWDAIQAGAVSNAKLTTILKNSDLDKVKELATPRTNTVMTSTKLNRANAMLASGYTQAEVADALGVALSTLKSSIGGS